MTALPTDIRAQDARLPAAYEAAKDALANCASIDECQSWANKAEALASYARQADDDTLRKQADRIQARAIRRCGELITQFKSAGGRPAKTADGGVTSSPASQKQAAADAGMSERQRVTAVRVANVPVEAFERAVESEAPPTVTKLADMGRKPVQPPPPPPVPRPVVDHHGRDPHDFNLAMHFEAMIEGYATDLGKWNLADVLPRLIESERSSVRALITKIDAVHDAIITRI